MMDYLRIVAGVAVACVMLALSIVAFVLPIYLATTVSAWWLFGYVLLPFVLAAGFWLYERSMQ